MKEILKKYEENILVSMREDFTDVENIIEIRVNMSAVYHCEYQGRKCILKYLIVQINNMGDGNDSWNEYSIQHAEKLLILAESPSFPSVYERKYYTFDEIEFLLIIEEFFPHNFQKGMLVRSEKNSGDIIKTVQEFLIDLLYLYVRAEEVGFISHRDLSFDNLMFDKDYKLKMIDLGSAKSEDVHTTMFHILAPTKLFYAAPEFTEIHKYNKTTQELIKAEIYTIGLLALSLMISLKKGLFSESSPLNCGVIYWMREHARNQNLGENLKEAHKLEYINYILFEIFLGDGDNKLFRLLKVMTDKSISVRPKSYEIIIKQLEKGL